MASWLHRNEKAGVPGQCSKANLDRSWLSSSYPAGIWDSGLTVSLGAVPSDSTASGLPGRTHGDTGETSGEWSHGGLPGSGERAGIGWEVRSGSRILLPVKSVSVGYQCQGSTSVCPVTSGESHHPSVASGTLAWTSWALGCLSCSFTFCSSVFLASTLYPGIFSLSSPIKCHLCLPAGLHSNALGLPWRPPGGSETPAKPGG